MSPELDKRLVETFPLLYRDRHASMRETCMCWGFDHGDGWFDIIWEASSKIEPIIASLIEKYKDDKDFQEYPPRATQVKEKFGTLRFYMSSETVEISKIIDEAESKSEVTCEDCGKPGVLRKGGWLRTLCDEHSQGREQYGMKKVTGYKDGIKFTFLVPEGEEE